PSNLEYRTMLKRKNKQHRPHVLQFDIAHHSLLRLFIPIHAMGTFAQMPALHLAKKILRQLADNLDSAGAFLLAQVLLAMILQRSQIKRLSWFGNHQGLDDFTTFGIGNTDNRCFRHVRKGFQDFLNLRWEDQKSRRLDDVLLAVDDGEITVP